MLANGDMLPVANYREWIYLSSGMDMSYSPQPADMTMFDNVFVNPEAYRSFVATGTWPDKTVLVLENREAKSNGSINQHGHFQGGSVMGIEVHVKDVARYPGGWAFFHFASSTANGKLFPHGCRMLLLPSGARGGGHHVRAVLSDSVANRARQKDAERGIPERGVSAGAGQIDSARCGTSEDVPELNKRLEPHHLEEIVGDTDRRRAKMANGCVQRARAQLVANGTGAAEKTMASTISASLTMPITRLISASLPVNAFPSFRL